MAAAKLVTRCPACRTAFRLVADQLRLRQGLVRCGQCDTVFDAREHLIEVPVPAAAPVSVAAALAHAEQTQATARAREHETPFDPGFDPGYDVPALDSPTMMMSEAEQAAAEEAPAEEAPVEAAPAEEAPAGEPPVEEARPPSAPWPTLDHAAFGDSVPGHSSLDPAAAFAPPSASAAPPSGVYSAKATWPPVKPAGSPAAAPAPVAPPAPPPADALPTPNPFPATEPVRSASEYLRAADPAVAPPDAFARDADPYLAPPAGATEAPRDGTPDAIARESTTRHWIRREPTAGPVFAPDFLRHTRDRERPRAPRAKLAAPVNKRFWARAAVVVLAIGALLQGTYLARSQLAGRVPVLRPLLEAACAPLGCDVPPWRDLEALRIDSSQLQKQDEASDVYQLAVTMRNQGRATTALPAIELVMTDLQDQLLLRRVLQPAEYLEPAQRGFATMGLRAGSELPVRVRFRTQQTAANYRVLIFYP